MDLLVTSKSEFLIKSVLPILVYQFSSVECALRQIEKRLSCCDIEVNISVDHSDLGTENFSPVKEETNKVHVAYTFVCIGTVEFCKDGYVQSEYFKTFNCKQKSETKRRLRSPVSESLYQGREVVIGSKLLHMPFL